MPLPSRWKILLLDFFLPYPSEGSCFEKREKNKDRVGLGVVFGGRESRECAVGLVFAAISECGWVAMPAR